MILIAENITVTNPVVRAAVENSDPKAIELIIDAAKRAGAKFIDVNLGPGHTEDHAHLEFVLDTLRAHWEGGVWMDTADWRAAEFAASNYGDLHLVLNGYCPGRERMLEVAAAFGLELTVFLMDGARVPKGVDERLALAAELVGRCSDAGVGAERLIIDPVLVPMGWMDGQELNASILEVIRALPTLFGPEIRSMTGLSNLVTGSTGQRRVMWLEEVFLAAAAGAGLTHVMLDITNPELVRVAKALAVLDGQTPFAPAELA